MKKEVIILGGGCFWCTEAIYQEVEGVLSVLPGYAGGTTPNPTYEMVCTGKTGHAEVTRIEFDAEKVSLESLLVIFFGTHDPTSLNRQGHDFGPQYRSLILYTSSEQKIPIEKALQEAQKDLEDPIVTEVKPLEKFYEAEEGQQNYYKNNVLQPYCQLVINPKLSKLREKFQAYLKKE